MKTLQELRVLIFFLILFTMPLWAYLIVRLASWAFYKSKLMYEKIKGGRS